jgi:hypothetical protein
MKVTNIRADLDEIVSAIRVLTERDPGWVAYVRLFNASSARSDSAWEVVAFATGDATFESPWRTWSGHSAQSAIAVARANLAEQLAEKAGKARARAELLSSTEVAVRE